MSERVVPDMETAEPLQTTAAPVRKSAIVALILSVLWVAGGSVVWTVVAVLLAHWTLHDIHKSGGRGEYVTIAALVLGYLGIAAWLVLSGGQW